MSAAPRQPSPSRTVYWVLRVAETVLLLGGLAGIVGFAWTIVDAFHGGMTGEFVLPAMVWPSILVFFGSMLLLQVVRGLIAPHRRDDGTPKADARAAAARTTAEVLAEDEDDRGSDAAGPAADGSTDENGGA